ncbi:hypothetical protein MKW92_004555 [Papaver armeniacum]|nr:hypothetical protein MKW92_004555 [Papaver armeniacum]
MDECIQCLPTYEAKGFVITSLIIVTGGGSWVCAWHVGIGVIDDFVCLSSPNLCKIHDAIDLVIPRGSYESKEEVGDLDEIIQGS